MPVLIHLLHLSLKHDGVAIVDTVGEVEVIECVAVASQVTCLAHPVGVLPP